MKESSSYGNNYWCVKIHEIMCETCEEDDGTVTDPAEIYLYADTCDVLPSGALEFRQITRNEKTGETASSLNMAIAPGEWICVFSADVDDGRALAVEA